MGKDTSFTQKGPSLAQNDVATAVGDLGRTMREELLMAMEVNLQQE